MKRICGIISALVLSAGLVFAGDMWNTDFSKSLANAAAMTNALTIRGDLEAVAVNMTYPTGNATQTVALTYMGRTVWTGAFATNAIYPVRTALYDATGTAITYTSSTNGQPGAVNNVLYGKIPIAGVVTSIVTQTYGTACTNTVHLNLIYRQ